MRKHAGAYTVTYEPVIGEGPEPVWAVHRDGFIVLTFASKALAIGTARHLALADGCAAWLITDHGMAVLLAP